MEPTITQRCVPGGDPARIRVFTQSAGGAGVAVFLSIQEEALGSRGIIRALGPPFVTSLRRGAHVRVEDPARQRDGFLPVLHRRDSHLRRFEKTRPNRRVVAVTGCGNLLCNAGVGAWTRGIRAGIPGFSRAGILVDPRGRGVLVEGARVASVLACGLEGRSPDRFFITGPLLVTRGRPVTPDAREYADLRHLLLPGFVKAGGGRCIDFGFDALHHDARARADAAAGRPVTLRLTAAIPASDALDAPLVDVQIDADALRVALKAKGYVEARSPKARGEFRVGARAATIAFLPGIYPHHALALDGNGAVVSIVVTGRSNREGTTVVDLAKSLADAGASAAILLDNGGDVGMLRRKGAAPRAPLAFVARPAEADRARAWPLRACLVYHEPATAQVTRRG